MTLCLLCCKTKKGASYFWGCNFNHPSSITKLAIVKLGSKFMIHPWISLTFHLIKNFLVQLLIWAQIRTILVAHWVYCSTTLVQPMFAQHDLFYVDSKVVNNTLSINYKYWIIHFTEIGAKNHAQTLEKCIFFSVSVFWKTFYR